MKIFIVLFYVLIAGATLIFSDTGVRRNPFEFLSAPVAVTVNPAKVVDKKIQKVAPPVPVVKVLQLQGIIFISSQNGQVILNQVPVAVGESYRGWVLSSITPTGAVLIKGKMRRWVGF